MKYAATMLAAAALFGLVWFMFMPLVEPKAPRQKFKAQGEVDNLAGTVFTLIDGKQIRPLLDGKSGSFQVANGQMFEALSAWNNSSVNRIDTEWAKLHRFTDPWGHDYLFLFESRTNKQKSPGWAVKVRSIGPNGIDEQGKGDDLTSRTFESVP
jgi:hypothetical protein